MSEEKCFCHLNGYKVKDADARAEIAGVRAELEQLKQNNAKKLYRHRIIVKFLTTDVATFDVINSSKTPLTFNTLPNDGYFGYYENSTSGSYKIVATKFTFSIENGKNFIWVYNYNGLYQATEIKEFTDYVTEL